MNHINNEGKFLHQNQLPHVAIKLKQNKVTIRSLHYFLNQKKKSYYLNQVDIQQLVLQQQWLTLRRKQLTVIAQYWAGRDTIILLLNLVSLLDEQDFYCSKPGA